jgi:hypothetical protein
LISGGGGNGMTSYNNFKYGDEINTISCEHIQISHSLTVYIPLFFLAVVFIFGIQVTILLHPRERERERPGSG